MNFRSRWRPSRGGAQGIGAATNKKASVDNIFDSPTTKFSKTNHLASTVTQVQKVEKGRWVVVKDGLMF